MASTVTVNRSRAHQQTAVNAKQILSVQQSTEAVQIMMTSTVGTIAFLRELMPEKYFEPRAVGHKRDTLRYKDFAAGMGKRDHNRDGVVAMIIKRGHSVRGERITELLEHGVYDALHRGVLLAFRMTVLSSANDDGKVLETYTITSNPAHGPDVNLEANSPRGHTLTIGAVQGHVDKFIRDVQAFCETLPQLPPQRFLRLELLSKTSGEEGILPSGFHSVENIKAVWPQFKGWKKSRHEGTSFDGGNSRMELEVDHLEPEHRSDEKTSGKGQSAASIPGPAEEVGEEDSLNLPGTGADDRTPLTEVTTEQAYSPWRTPMEESPSARSLPRAVEFESTMQDTQPAKTQQSNKSGLAIRMEDQLSKMLLPQDVDIQFSPTQPVLLREGRKTIEAPDKHSNPEVASRLVTLRVGRANSQALSTKRRDLSGGNISLDSRVAAEQSPRESRERRLAVECLCGTDEHQCDMIKCTLCGKWQHLNCHGFTDEDDSRLPDMHICYKCLIHPPDDVNEVLSKLAELAMKRRAIVVVSRGGLVSAAGLMQLLNIRKDRASRLFAYMKVEKRFIVDAPGSHHKGYSQSGKPKYVITSNESVKTDMRAELFNPWSHIQHYYTPSEDIDDVAESPQSLNQKSNAGNSTTTERPHRRQKHIVSLSATTHTPVVNDATMQAEITQATVRSRDSGQQRDVDDGGWTKKTTARKEPQNRHMPATPCRKRLANREASRSGPSEGTRSNSKRQRWSMSDAIYVGENYTTPR